MLRDPLDLDAKMRSVQPLATAPSYELCRLLREANGVPREVAAVVLGTSLATLARFESGCSTRLPLSRTYRAFLAVMVEALRCGDPAAVPSDLIPLVRPRGAQGG